MKQQPIRRVVLLENHFPLIFDLASKSYLILPEHIKHRFTLQDLFHDCIVELQRKRWKYDARRGRFVTFAYWVVKNYLRKRSDYEKRARRNGHHVELNTAIHGGSYADELETTDEETLSLFVTVYRKLGRSTRGQMIKWFLTRYSQKYKQLPAHIHGFVTFRRTCKQVGLGYEHCSRVLNDRNLRIKIHRRLINVEQEERISATKADKTISVH